MTDTLQYRNPLDSLMEIRTREEQEEAERAKADAILHQAEREAAELARRAAVKRQHLQNEVLSFAEGFFLAIANHAKTRKWSVSAIRDAKSYAEYLLRSSDVDEPKVDTGIMHVVRDKFTYGLALSSDRMPNVMRDNYFVGQRQDWFTDLFAQKQRDVQHQHGNR